ncbi:hypothetical protein R0J87_18380, partial [Halomonas sp. SIMBA_159]
PGEDGTGGTEVSGGGYSRVTTSATDWNAATLADPSVLDNANAIDFGSASGANWGTIVAVGLYDASTAGNFLGAFDRASNVTVNDGDSFSIAAGDFDLKAD